MLIHQLPNLIRACVYIKASHGFGQAFTVSRRNFFDEVRGFKARLQQGQCAWGPFAFLMHFNQDIKGQQARTFHRVEKRPFTSVNVANNYRLSPTVLG